MKKILAVVLVVFGMSVYGGKNEIVVNFEYEPYNATLDAQLAVESANLKIDSLLIEGLNRENENGMPVPGIAEKWDIAENGLEWTFYLRDAEWENGEAVTASDFKFAWLRALDPKNKAEFAYMLFPIAGAQEFHNNKGSAEEVGIKVVNDKTLKVILKSPTGYLDSLLVFPVYTPLNEKYYNTQKGKYGNDAGAIISNGPYRLVKWSRNKELVLEKNEKYWNKNEVKNEIIKMKLIDDAYESLQAFENNEIDFTEITIEQYSEFRNDKRLISYDDSSTWYLEYNLKNDFLSNKKIRQALTMAVDKEELAEKLEIMVKPAYGFVSYAIKGEKKSFREEAGDTFPHYNPEKARKLFAEGLKELKLDKAPEMTLIFNDLTYNKRIVDYIQEKIKKELGYSLVLEALPFKERLLRMVNKDFDIILTGWSGDYNDALNYMDLWITDGGQNYTSYSNLKYDELIRIAQTSPDQKVRIQAMINAEKLLGDDMPIGMLYYRQRMVLVNPRLKNMKFRAIGSKYYLNDAYVE